MSLFFRQDSSNSPNEVFLDDLQSVIAMVLSLIIVSSLSRHCPCHSCARWTMDDEMDDMSQSESLQESVNFRNEDQLVLNCSWTYLIAMHRTFLIWTWTHWNKFHPGRLEVRRGTGTRLIHFFLSSPLPPACSLPSSSSSLLYRYLSNPELRT
jgi:hypothetical protein